MSKTMSISGINHETHAISAWVWKRFASFHILSGSDMTTHGVWRYSEKKIPMTSEQDSRQYSLVLDSSR